MVNVVLGIILMLKTIKDALKTYLESGRDFLFFAVPTLISFLCAGLSMIDHTSAILVVPWVYIFVLIPFMLVPTLRDWCVKRLSALRFLHIQDLVEMLDSLEGQVTLSNFGLSNLACEKNALYHGFLRVRFDSSQPLNAAKSITFNILYPIDIQILSGEHLIVRIKD